MKTVAIIHKDSPEIGTYPEGYGIFYASLASRGEKIGLRFCEASAYDWDVEKGGFSRVRIGGKIVSDVRPDAVWHKNSGVNAFVLAIERSLGRASVNRSETIALAGDKYATYRRFGHRMARTELLSAALREPGIVAGWRGDKVVVKPRRGHAGSGVRVVPKSALPADLADVAGQWIVQEWVDSSGGVPGLADGAHDVRAVFVDGRVNHYCVRTPKKGLAFVDSSCEQRDYLPDEVRMPEGFASIWGEVASKLGGGLYAVDCMWDSSVGPLLGEINGAPGVDAYAPDGSPEALERLLDGYHVPLVGLLAAACR